MQQAAISISRLCKSFVMHLQGGARLDVIRDASFDVAPGACTVLGGPSGAGKSSILKMIFGNYRIDSGTVLVRHQDRMVDVAQAAPRDIMQLRAQTVGYVSQFLRVIPRVSAIDIVAEAARDYDESDKRCRDRAAELLARLNVPERLWHLAPATFSGGEQQRVNIARGFIAQRPILLLDEPTASLDAANRAVVVELIRERKQAGAAILGIFHDQNVRDAVNDAVIDVSQFARAAA